ncbi:hypothetical protein B0T10DRAFT_556170 [Thelonectria olida]|uniref:Zn(2)-C6 fungal-type domain-containing protein n=1 Tax=Thelonectria olida TaxID=1576542 RepID=A0A9P9AVH2_9HYPO|nr:hypothetical protein B0T10DRAFT_556170 [Thelonectria olida]
MPNTGKPSKDCHLCRSRRVKCDLAKPACQRCIKYGAECPGYRNEQELVFRNANPANIKKRKKRSQKGSTKGSDTSSSTQSTPSPSEVDYTTPSDFLHDPEWANALTAGSSHIVPISRGDVPFLPQSLNQHWTTHSIPILLNVYSTLEFLHDIYRENDNDGPLVWAAHLFSRTYVTNLKHSTAMHKDSGLEAEQEIGKYLGKTLSAVHFALKSPEGALRDDVLATVWILANYELLMGSINRMEPLSPWHLHTRGLYSILKERGTKWLIKDGGRAGFWPAYNMVQVQCLLTNIECPPESDEWLGIIRDNSHPMESVALHVSVFITKVAHVQARIQTILSNADYATASTEYHDLVGCMSTAEDDLKKFFESGSFLSHDLDPYMLNMYYSTRVKGYHLLMIFVTFLTHHIAAPVPLLVLQALRTHCIEIVHSSAQKIVDGLPQTLDPTAFRRNPAPKTLFDALKLIWPLTAVYVFSSTLESQKEVARKALAIIGRELGVRQALKVYKFEDRFPPECRRPVDLVEDGLACKPFSVPRPGL